MMSCRRSLAGGVLVLWALVAAGCGGGIPEIREPTANYLTWGAKGRASPTLTAPDHDDDGVPNETDRCPDLPEDVDTHRDDDGCPDPDNDGDGVPDAKDDSP